VTQTGLDSHRMKKERSEKTNRVTISVGVCGSCLRKGRTTKKKPLNSDWGREKRQGTQKFWDRLRPTITNEIPWVPCTQEKRGEVFEKEEQLHWKKAPIPKICR